MSEAVRPESPRTLADQLRGWSDDALAGLLTERPDLATPAPQDSGQLASRAATRASVARAVDRLDRLELATLDAVLVCGGTASTSLLRARVHAAPEAVDGALAHLRRVALVWGDDDALRVVSVVGEVLGSSVSGLGTGAETLLGGYGPGRVAALATDLGLAPSGDRHTDVLAVAAALADHVRVEELVAEVDDRARAILDHLEREGRDGSVESADRAARRGEAGGPVDQLLARGLLVARDRRHVSVPREVALSLRGGHTTREPVDAMPEVVTAEWPVEVVDHGGAGAASETVRHVEMLLEHWGTAPPAALRTGGLAVRDLKATAELLHVETRVAALLVETAAAAGLLTTGPTEEREAAWLPTDAFDAWSTLDPAHRWARLALAWLDSPRLVGLVGGRREGKPVNALAPDLERAWLPGTRYAALREVAALPAGQVLAAGTGTASLVARLEWLRPRRPRSRAEAVGWALEEAAALGVTSRGGATGAGRALLGQDPVEQAAALLEPLLPEPVDHVLLQNDLTAVAPGPLAPELARRLTSLADVESRGGATTYRFSDGSVRRAFDAGWSAAEVHGFLVSSSRTPVPQALTYLVDDVSRRFGTVRAGSAESFLRSDDEVALAELVHHPKAASLRLRRIAPTVVVSDVPLDVLLPRLRELGASPVVEAPDGTVRLARPDVLRARTPRVPPDRAAVLGVFPDGQSARDHRAAARSAARVAATVTAVRAGDRAARTRPVSRVDGHAPRTTPASTMAVLQEATEGERTVCIGYVDNHGTAAERVVDPLTLEGGWLTAYDHRSDEVRSFAVHRITGVAPL